MAHYGIAKGARSLVSKALISKMVAAKTPLGRAGRPKDLESVIVYLASDLSRYHTGDTLVIDGGKLNNN